MSNTSNKPPVMFTPEQLLLLEENFREMIPAPGINLDTLMFSGGQRQVVDFVRRRTPGAMERVTKR